MDPAKVVALPQHERHERHEAAVPSAAKARIITAALDLFARHGVGGTSLGMIAKSLGVTPSGPSSATRSSSASSPTTSASVA